jgi:DNA-binding GntR family transcriptional regulator
VIRVGEVLIIMNEVIQNDENLLKYEPLSKLAVEALRKDIIEGRLEPGTKQTEDSIAKRLGVSRVVIREALILLEAEGLILKERNKFTLVVSFNKQDIIDVYDVRVALETCAAAILLRNTVDIVPKLREKVKDFREFFDSGTGDLGEFVRRDISLHRLIIEYTNNSRLIGIWNGIESQLLTLLFKFVNGQSRKFLEDIIRYDHDKIIAAFEKRDPDVVKNVLSEHITDCIDYLIALNEQ